MKALNPVGVRSIPSLPKLSGRSMRKTPWGEPLFEEVYPLTQEDFALLDGYHLRVFADLIEDSMRFIDEELLGAGIPQAPRSGLLARFKRGLVAEWTRVVLSLHADRCEPDRAFGTGDRRRYAQFIRKQLGYELSELGRAPLWELQDPASASDGSIN